MYSQIYNRRLTGCGIIVMDVRYNEQTDSKEPWGIVRIGSSTLRGTGRMEPVQVNE